MGKSWCVHLPHVTVPKRDTPKPLTLLLPFYRNTQFLLTQISGWHSYAEDLKCQLNAIIVDDGSPEPAADVLQNVALPFPMRLFRIEQDCRWNWLAARNIGFHHSVQGWVLVTDMDHVVPEYTMRNVLYGDHHHDTIYGFSRREHTGEWANPHPNSWLMTRAMFWKVGGYDEALSGLYGTDGDWRRRCAQTAPMAILKDNLIRHEYQQDSSTTHYLRKHPIDAAVKGIIAKRGEGWKPKTLSFAYAEVPLNQEAACL
jgi:hypothetical protein